MGRGANAVVEEPVDFDLDVTRSAATGEEILSNSLAEIAKEFKGIVKDYHKAQKRIWPLLYANQQDFEQLRQSDPELWRQIVRAAAYYKLPNGYGGDVFSRWISDIIRDSRLVLDRSPLLYGSREKKPRSGAKRTRLHLRADPFFASTLCGVEVPNPKDVSRHLNYCASHFTTGDTGDYIRCDRCLKALQKLKGPQWAAHHKLAAQRGPFLPAKSLQPIDRKISAVVEERLLSKQWQSTDQMRDEIGDLFWPVAIDGIVGDQLGDFFTLNRADQISRLTMPYGNTNSGDNSSLLLFRGVLRDRYGDLRGDSIPWPESGELQALFSEVISAYCVPKERDDGADNFDYDDTSSATHYGNIDETRIVSILLDRIFPEAVIETLERLRGLEAPDNMIRYWRAAHPGNSGSELEFVPV